MGNTYKSKTPTPEQPRWIVLWLSFASLVKSFEQFFSFFFHFFQQWIMRLTFYMRCFILIFYHDCEEALCHKKALSIF